MIKYNSSIRKFNKSRKRLPLGKDNNSKMLYPYDFVKVQNTMETKSSHCSRIWWNALDGAFIDSHPAHIILNNCKSRNLRDYLNHNDSSYYKITCVKITYNEYLEWEKINDEK